MENKRQNANASNVRQPYQSNISSGNQQNQTSTRTNRSESTTRSKASTAHAPSTSSTVPTSSVRSNVQDQSHSRSQPDANYKINPTPSNRNFYPSNTRQQQEYRATAPSTSREQMGIQPTSNVARNSVTSPSVRNKPTTNAQEEKFDRSFIIDSSSGGSVVSSGQGDRQPYQNYQTSNVISKQQYPPGNSTKQQTLQPGSNRTGTKSMRNIKMTAPSMKSKTSVQVQEKTPDNSSMDSNASTRVGSTHGDYEQYHCNVNSKQQYNPATTRQLNDGYRNSRSNTSTSVIAKSTTQEVNPSKTSSSSSQETTESSSGDYSSTLGLSGTNIAGATPSATIQQCEYSSEQGTSFEGSPSFEWGSTSTWTSTPGKDNSYRTRECGGQSCNDPCCCCGRSNKNCTPTPQRTNSNYEQQEKYPLPTQRDQNKGRCQTDYKYEDQACNRSIKPSCNTTQTKTPCIQPRGQEKPIITSPEKGKYFYENRPNRRNYEPDTCKPSTSFEPVKRPRDRSIVQSPYPWHSQPQPNTNTSSSKIDRQYVGPLDLIPPVYEYPGNNFPQDEGGYSKTSPRPKRRKPNIPTEVKPMEEPGKSSVRHWYELMSSAVCSLFNNDERSSTSPEPVIPRRSHVRNKLKRRRSNTSSSSITMDSDDTRKPTVIFIKEATIYINDIQSQDSGSRSRSLVGVEVSKEKRQRLRQSNSQKRSNSRNQYNPIGSPCPTSNDESASSEGTQEDRAAYILASCARRICESKGCRDDFTIPSKRDKGKKK